MARREELTDEQWAMLAPLIPVQPRRADGRGRSLKHDDRAVLNGVLWALRTGAAWADLPERFPSGSTCFRRFSRWVKAERLFAWLNKYKRVMTRWDRCGERFTAFVHLALAMSLLRRLQRCL
jgi:transposase